MNEQSKTDSSLKAASTVSALCKLLEMSRSQYYLLAKRGIFHLPLYLETTKRPYLTASMVEDCIQARYSGIGVNGQVVLFNERKRVDTKEKPAAKVDYTSIIAGLRQLGLEATKEHVQQALDNEYPRGIDGIDEPTLITKVFRWLKRSGNR